MVVVLRTEQGQRRGETPAQRFFIVWDFSTVTLDPRQEGAGTTGRVEQWSGAQPAGWARSRIGERAGRLAGLPAATDRNRRGGTARCPLAAHRPAAQSTRRLDRRLRLASGLLLRGLIAVRAGGDAPGSGCSAARGLRPPWPGLIARPASLRLLCPPASACCGLRPPRGHSIACGA